MINRLAFLDSPNPEHDASRLASFSRLFACTLLIEQMIRAGAHWDTYTTLHVGNTLVGIIAAVAALFTPLRRAAFAVLFVNLTTIVWRDFPATGNHAYLETMIAGFLALLDPDEEVERTAILRALGWTAIVVLLASGVHKLVQGYYFRGQYLAYATWIESFRTVIAPLAGPDEFVRFIKYSGVVGDGPYISKSPALLAASNLVYLAEIGLALMLIVRRTRTFAVLATVAMLVGIEVAAREFFFGMVFINLVMLLAPSDLHRRIEPFAMVALVALLVLRFVWAPEFKFY